MTTLQMTGLHHVALFVNRFEDCLDFYTRVLQMRIEWHPDADNIYLTSGTDNLALHRSSAEFVGEQRLDHIGFIIPTSEMVFSWYEKLQTEPNVKILTVPRLHRDGATSFYCLDPDGIRVQMIHHPPLEGKFLTSNKE